jgi:predicted  nucleic acid-binding Zn-ribbon protein
MERIIMNYYKDKITNQVYAYDDEQLSVVARMNELEKLIQTKEPYYIEVSNNLHQSTVELERLKRQLDNAIESEATEDIISVLTIEVDEATEAHNQAMAIYVPVDAEYQSLKTEYDAILPVFFEVRENISIMKKMSAKEVDAI